MRGMGAWKGWAYEERKNFFSESFNYFNLLLCNVNEPDQAHPAPCGQ